jgi:hypothetical protein
MTYDFNFSQDLSQFIGTGVTSAEIYGQLGDRIANIEIEGLGPFMDLSNKTVSQRHLDLLPGDSLALVLYGNTYKIDNAGNLVAEFVRYTTSTGYDFSTTDQNVLIQNLGFTAATRETATVILKTPTTTLTSTPYNFYNVCNAKANDNDFDSLEWVVDTNWSSKSLGDRKLQINVAALSTLGQGKITRMLGVTDRSPQRIVVCNYPNRIDLRSGDGSSLYTVNAFGTLRNLSTVTNAVTLQGYPEENTTDVGGYAYYNALIGYTV